VHGEPWFDAEKPLYCFSTERFFLAHHGPEQAHSTTLRARRRAILQLTKVTMWYVYIIRCRDGSLYTGSTTDISRRIKEHNSGKGGSYTRIRQPVKLLYKEIWPSRSKAQARETQIKGWAKRKKLALIYHDKRTLKQLSQSHD